MGKKFQGVCTEFWHIAMDTDPLRSMVGGTPAHWGHESPFGELEEGCKVPISGRKFRGAGKKLWQTAIGDFPMESLARVNESFVGLTFAT